MLTPIVPIIDEAAVLKMLQKVPARAPFVSVCSALLVCLERLSLQWIMGLYHPSLEFEWRLCDGD